MLRPPAFPAKMTLGQALSRCRLLLCAVLIHSVPTYHSDDTPAPASHLQHELPKFETVCASCRPLLLAAILRRADAAKLKPVVLRPAFYGMLLFQQAVGPGAVLLPKQQLSVDTSWLKVWPLRDTTTGELRFVLINKHPKLAATQVLKLSPADTATSSSSGGRYQSTAQLSRLVAQGEDPLSATTGITLAGRYYAAGCVEQGQDATLLLEADAGPSKQLSWSIYLPPGSATLVRIQEQQPQQPPVV